MVLGKIYVVWIDLPDRILPTTYHGTNPLGRAHPASSGHHSRGAARCPPHTSGRRPLCSEREERWGWGTELQNKNRSGIITDIPIDVDCYCRLTHRPLLPRGRFTIFTTRTTSWLSLPSRCPQPGSRRSPRSVVSSYAARPTSRRRAAVRDSMLSGVCCQRHLAMPV